MILLFFKRFKLNKFIKFNSIDESLKYVDKLNKGKLSKPVKKEIKKCSKINDQQTYLAQSDKLSSILKSKLKSKCLTNDLSREIMRKIGEKLPQMLEDNNIEVNNDKAQLGLAHKYVLLIAY